MLGLLVLEQQAKQFPREVTYNHVKFVRNMFNCVEMYNKQSFFCKDMREDIQRRYLDQATLRMRI